MTPDLGRRAVVSGLLAGIAAPLWAGAPARALRPLPRPSGDPADRVARRVEAEIDAVGLGGAVSYALIDVASGEILGRRAPLLPQPPASTAKALTALYALDRLGPAYRFATTVVALGPVEGGIVKGDVALVGGGDPTLDTDAMLDLVEALGEAGITGATGRLLTWGGGLAEGPAIDADQPVQVGYNPSFGGLNLNFNRVHFEWEKSGSDYKVTMEARGRRASPATSVAHMALVDRRGPVYAYEATNGVDSWSVARGALGRGGARWLPVRDPAAYAGDVFRALAAEAGISLGAAEPAAARPKGAVLARVASGELAPMLKSMLRYSTNLTAEVTGLAASFAAGAEPETLAESAAELNRWAAERYGVRGVGLVDHSGLGYPSRITAIAMARMMQGAATTALPGLLKRFAVEGLSDGTVRAKTGTLNFTSALAGYVDGRSGPLAFAIFMSDVARRNAIPPAQRERPPGARGYEARARTLQREMLRIWARTATA